MTTTKTTDALLKQLKRKATKGTAGRAQAKKAISKKKPRAAKKTASRKPKPKEKGKGQMGNTVSCYLHTEEQQTITAIRGELLTGEGCDANQSHIIRAGLLALKKLSHGAVAGLVEDVKALDGRRKE